jgi:hypothetical protein
VKKGLKVKRNSSKRFRRLPLTVIAASVILAVGAVTVISRQLAAGKAEPNRQEKTSPASNAANKRYVTVKVAGRDVQVDGQTGQIRELTPEEKEKLAAGLREVINQSDEGLVQVHNPDGSVSMDLQGRFQDVAVAKRNDDGSVSQSCVNNPQAAGEFFGIDPQMIENKPGKGETGKQPIRSTPVRNQNQ